MSVPRKYGLLRGIAIALKVLGVLVLVLGLVLMLGALLSGNVRVGGQTLASLGLPVWLTAAGGIAFLMIGLVGFVQLFAFGSILSLLIDIEESTRALALPQR